MLVDKLSHGQANLSSCRAARVEEEWMNHRQQLQMAHRFSKSVSDMLLAASISAVISPSDAKCKFRFSET